MTSCTKTKQQSLSDIISKKEAYKKNSPRYQTCQNALVFFMCNDLQPISVVDSPAFCQLLHTLDPRFQPYSRTQFSRVIIPMKYDEVKQSIKEKLDKAKFISLTTLGVIIMVTSLFLLITLAMTGKCIITA